jgi:hypothetical protein
MRNLATTGAALAAVFALSLSIVGTAAATEATKILPEATEASPITFTGLSGPGTLETVGSTKVTCEEDTETGSVTSANLGKFKLLFEHCTSVLSSKCTSLTATTSGDIQAEGTFHYWLAKDGSELVSALVYLLKETHFTCTVSGIETLELVKGCMAGQLEEAEKSTKFTVTGFTGSKGVNAIAKVLPQESPSEIGCQLETSVSGGTFEQTDLTTNEMDTGFTRGEAIEISPMCGTCSTKAAAITATPKNANFGPVKENSTGQLTITYKNGSGAEWNPAAGFGTLYGKPGAFSAENKCVKVPIGEMCEVVVKFTPKSKARYVSFLDMRTGGELVILEGQGT